jgi:hypothetical protein
MKGRLKSGSAKTGAVISASFQFFEGPLSTQASTQIQRPFFNEALKGACN